MNEWRIACHIVINKINTWTWIETIEIDLVSAYKQIQIELQYLLEPEYNFTTKFQIFFRYVQNW